MRTLFPLLGVAIAACSCPDQSKLLPNPADPSARGPYTVGAILGSIDVHDGRFGLKRNITVEVWYPATPGSSQGASQIAYDIREHVPRQQQAQLKDAANVTRQLCDCFRGLKVADGRFPVVLMIHGTAAFRTASLHQQTHWASRGFIVFAADHPGIQLKDMLGIVDGIIPPKEDQEGDARGILRAIARLPTAAPAFAELSEHLDMNKIAIVGHSAGGITATDNLGDVADVLIPMSGLAPAVSSRVKSTLILTARNDTIIGYSREVSSYDECKIDHRRFAAVDALGHLFCTDLCWIGESAGGIVQIAIDHGIKSAKLFKALGQNGCSYLNAKTGTRYLEPKCGWQFVNYATSAALEETLRCDAGMVEALVAMKSALPVLPGCPTHEVFEYRQSFGITVPIVV